MQPDPIEFEHMDDKQKDTHLWHAWKQSPTPRNMSNLVKRFRGAMVKKVREQSGSVPDSALETEINGWIVHAVRTYDPNAGASLNTHVNNWITKVTRMNYENQNAARLSEGQQLKYRQYHSGMQELSTQLNRDPSPVELAGHLNWSVRQVKKMQREIFSDLYDAGEDNAHVATSFSHEHLVHGFIHDNLTQEERDLLGIIAGDKTHKLSNEAQAKLAGVNVNRFNYLKRKLTDKVSALKTEMENLNAASTRPRRVSTGT